MNRKKQLKKAQDRGPSAYERLRGPNTGAWEKIIGQEAPGARLKYMRIWNSKYNTRGTW